jgi:hypothetical protein
LYVVQWTYGQGGGVKRYDGSSWAQISTLSPDRMVTSAWAAGSGELYTAERMGFVTHLSPSGTSEALDARGTIVRGTSDGAEVWVGGWDDKSVSHYDGQGWSTETLPSKALDLAVAGRDSVWALVAGGAAPELLRYDGTSWQESPAPAPAGLFRIWADESGNVYGLSRDSQFPPATGAQIHVFDGSAWQAQEQTDDFLYALQGAGGVIYAVGSTRADSSSGVVWRNDGGNWVRITDAELGTGLGDLTCITGGPCIAVGGSVILALDSLH